jgi:hypothetical protein
MGEPARRAGAPGARSGGWEGRATISEMEEAPMRVTLTEPEIAGSYVVAEQRDDGTLVLRPETSDEVIERFGDRTLSEDELLDAFARLHGAAEREEGDREGRGAAAEER